MKTQQLKLPQQANPNRTRANLNVAGAQQRSNRPTKPVQTKKEQGEQNLLKILPEPVAEALKKGSLSGALNAIQNLDDKGLSNFGKTIQQFTDKALPKKASELRAAFNTPDFATNFNKAIIAVYKAAEKNPEALKTNRDEFIRDQISAISKDLSKEPVALRQREEIAPTILTFPSKRDAAQSLARQAA